MDMARTMPAGESVESVERTFLGTGKGVFRCHGHRRMGGTA
jgi:hypothetical protein